MSLPRLRAAAMLQEILEKQVFLSEAKTKFSSDNETDAAFVNKLLLTVLRRLVYLRLALKQFVKKKLPPTAGWAEYALLLGAAEILYLRTPDYAVINSYVELTKQKTDKYVAGFVNAVLRKITAEADRLRAEDDGRFFPNDFRHLLKSSYGPKTLLALEQAAGLEAPLDLSAAQDPAALAERLGGRLLPLGTVRLPNAGNIAKLPEYSEGSWWVQDFSASLPVKMLGQDLRGRRVLDLCAAPGGKTAQLLTAGAEVTAVDISEPRLNILRQNLERLRLPAPREILCADALDYLKNLPEDKAYDVILLDAPCSATGTLRRHPELVHLKSAQDIARQTQIQQELLDAAAPAVKAGGILLYCVCSLSRAEGENQIRAFLDARSDFMPENLKPRLPEELYPLLDGPGWLRILPQHLLNEGGADGFFIAKLQKVGG